MSDLRTFLFADIRGYTTYTRERGDEAGAALAQEFAAIVEALAPAHDGTLQELRGDEALASGVAGGVALGIIVAVLRVGLNLITYAVQPLSVKIVVSWSIGGFLEAAVAGAIAGAIYKQARASAQSSP